MFDNLKKKLGSFRKDAEEAAEENVEDVDDEELEDVDAETADVDVETESDDVDTASETEVPDTTGEAAESGASESEGETEMAAPTEATASAESGASSTAEATEAEEPPAAEPSPEPDQDLEDEADETDEDTEDDGNSLGFGSKARSLVKGKFVIEEEDIEEPLQELEMALLSSDVEMGVAEEIIDNIRNDLVGETRTFTTSPVEVVEDALRDAIRDVISVGQFDFDERIAVEDKPVTIVFTGVNGVGKTTSIAKMSRYFEERGYSTVMANGDTYRAGANEQIEEHAEALDTKLITHEQGGDPAAVLYDGVEYAEANDIDVVLGDTAGRLHTDEGLMDQLEKIDRVVDPDMTLFVDEAVAGQDAVNRAREFNEAAEIDGAILTKADADSNGGAAISIAHVTGKPILFLGVGQGYDDLERFDPDEMVDRLLEDEE
ncbi:signal recognition particle-docking protein FtsY [Natronolimnohabitans sp. A-GB9]|uniref:signal recognition particle-docking protein FtsY n=1 Tax=Natronolimnohabitans sp. A-GB9 TaxID=3069757 RepID=UPI0027B3104B|nr:signal recognition particle-docking protein FtsY [Natronolimnohabitans sp. A-GB9]MDQ2050865.1 signal recognition particle-docking protein FtsY [Natronolimnohabitans sp. A-GB9]